jgi:hypothetical protein
MKTKKRTKDAHEDDKGTKQKKVYDSDNPCAEPIRKFGGICKPQINANVNDMRTIFRAGSYRNY